jgi:transposase, IS30 family
MGQEKISTRKKKYKHLSEGERYKIETYVRVGFKCRQIAEKLGKNASTISREIRKGTVKQSNTHLEEKLVYMADHGQREYEEKQSNKGRPLKIETDKELIRHIEKKIKEERYSPAAVMGEIIQQGLMFKTKPCIKTVYNYIHAGVFYRVGETDLIYGGRRKKKYRKIGKTRRKVALKSIEDRPQAADDRTKYGHWEIDIVKSIINARACLLTLTERLTRQEIILKLDSSTAEEVDRGLSFLEMKTGRYFSKIFKTITADNGSEFMDWEMLEESKLKPGTKRTTMYYAHPYSSYERGTNENSNRIIRRFIPKGSDIGKVTVEAIRKIQNWMNSYPRRIFNYQTANDMIRQKVTKKTWAILAMVQ